MEQFYDDSFFSKYYTAIIITVFHIFSSVAVLFLTCSQVTECKQY